MIMFYIEGEQKNTIGLQLGNHNILSSKGKIKIAKYKKNYTPEFGNGYNLEFILKIIIKGFKRRRKLKIKKILYQKFFINNLCEDVLKITEKYLL